MSDFSTEKMVFKVTERYSHGFVDHRVVNGSIEIVGSENPYDWLACAMNGVATPYAPCTDLTSSWIGAIL